MNRILEYIERHVKESPDKVCYKDNDRIITYEDLWHKAEFYADLLRRQGTSPVLVYGHKSPKVIIAILSCMMARRAYVPIDVFVPENRINKIAKITGSSLLLEAENMKLDGIECLHLSQLERYADADIKENDNTIAYIIFTSGSTGNPKGVPISASNLLNFIDWISSFSPLDTYKDAVVLNQASFSFDLSVADLFYSMCNGHTLVASEVSVQDGCEGVYRLMKEENVNVAVVTPTFMKMCLLDSTFKAENYPSFRCVYFCGELLEIPTVKKLFRRFPDIKIINAYGPTEATSAVSGILVEKEMLENELLPVGDAGCFATEIEIIDGEIVIKGKSVFGGYLGNVVGGWYSENGVNCYRTGDNGYIHDGKLYCKGRIDRQIKYKGYRIELDEIEYAIDNFCGVSNSAVIAKYTPSGTVKGIFAYVTLSHKSPLTEQEIKEELKNHIPSYMMPTSITILEELPVNSNGKTDRKALEQW